MLPGKQPSEQQEPDRLVYSSITPLASTGPSKGIYEKTLPPGLRQTKKKPIHALPIYASPKKAINKMNPNRKICIQIGKYVSELPVINYNKVPIKFYKPRDDIPQHFVGSPYYHGN